MPNMRKITRLLVANRGEIALRIMRTCREMGITPIAIYGDHEETAPHVRYAVDAVRLHSGANVPYLDIEAVLQAAVRMRVDAVHPGYGFLSENGDFADAVTASGITFVGPTSNAIRTMGDKIAARSLAGRAGVPFVPGTAEPVTDVHAARDAAAAIGYPIAVKAAGGGGGRGFRVARAEDELPSAFEGASGEAERYFRNPEVYLERYLERPRHIEVQLMADTHGNVVALGERECSIQRRHQKLVEESPSAAIGDELRQRLFGAAVALAREVDYVGAGTVEFLVDEQGEFYFLEMNTRIQVEHTVTEMVTGIDLVREQLRVAEGKPLSFDQSSIGSRGWAIECRINAEDPGRDFAPAPGRVTTYREPAGFGVRVDGALSAGDEILPAYDSMIAKLVTWGRDRPEAIGRMARALDDFALTGVPTTIPFHQRVIASQAFRDGDTTTSFLAEHPETIPPAVDPVAPDAGEEGEAHHPLSLLIEVDGRRFETTVRGLVASPTRGETANRRARRRASTSASAVASQDDLVSPIHGTVIRVGASSGDVVQQGQMIAVVEAMKMENELPAHKGGLLESVAIAVGSSVSIGQRIATITDEAGD